MIHHHRVSLTGFLHNESAKRIMMRVGIDGARNNVYTVHIHTNLSSAHDKVSVFFVDRSIQ